MDFPFSKLLMVCLVSPIRSPNSCVVQPQIFRNINKFSLEEEPDEVDVRILHRRIADQRIINAVTWYKVQHTQLFISNDKALLEAIVTADQMEAVHGKPVYATSLSDDGELIKYTKAKAIDWDAVDKDISDTNRDYINGKIIGTIMGSIFSTIIVGGISYLAHSHTKISKPCKHF